MNDLHTRDTIQLTRIHALNWYGFSDSFDLAGQTVITGVYGCGKTALIDLVQTVLLGAPEHENRYNLSVGDIGGSAKQIKRDLRGYALQDLNITDGKARVFARQGGRTYIALEWTWPDGKHRETWGLRIEYTSVGADQTIDYWHVPRRIDSTDFTGADEQGQEDVPLDADAWLKRIETFAGTRYASREKYLTHLAAGQHLNFDSRVLKPLLLQTLRFSFGSDFNTFCCEHILPEATIDIEAVRESYDTYRSFLARVKSLQEQEGELRKITEAFNRHRDLTEEIAALGYFEQTLLLEEKITALNKTRIALDDARLRHSAWETKLKSIQDRFSEADAAAKKLNQELADQPNAEEFEHLKGRQHALPREIEDLVQTVGDPAALVWSSNERLNELASQAIELARRHSWTAVAVALPQQSGRKVKLDARSAEALVPQLETAAEELAADWHELTRQAETKTQTLENQAADLRRDAARLREHGTTEWLPLREALQARFGKEDIVLLGDLCAVTDPAWADALEINFGHKLASLVPDEKITQAFAIFDGLTDVNSRERLVCRADLRALPGRVESRSLAEKIHSDDSAVQQLIAHLFGSLRCCESIAEAERYQRAILPSGAIKEPTGRRRQRATPSEYAIGRAAREAVINAKEEQAHRLAPDITAAKKRASAAAQLRDGFQSIKKALLQLRSGALANLRDLEGKRNEQVKIQSQLERIENRSALENLRSDAKAQRQAADAIAEDLVAHRASIPPDKAQLEQALKDAQESHGQTELHALAWQAEHPDAVSHAAKHRHLESEARTHATVDRLPSATCQFLAEKRRTEKANIGAECRMLRLKLKTHLRITDFRDFDVEDLGDNTLWEKKLTYIVETGIKEFTKKAEEAEIEWEERFQQNVLGQLLQRFQAIHETFRGLQRMIAGRTIGGAKYSFVHTQADRSDYNQLRALVSDLDLHRTWLAGDDRATADKVRVLRREAMKLFEVPANGQDQRSLTRQRELLDPRNYFVYDLEVTESGRSEAVSLNQRGRKASGGETYNPYLIALMTAYMRAYRRHERSTRPSISLLLMDEAFKVNDSAAVGDCVKIIAELGFQGVISCTNTVGSQVIEFFQWTMIVQKQVVQALVMGTAHDGISNTVYSAPKNDPDVLRIIGEIEDEEP